MQHLLNKWVIILFQRNGIEVTKNDEESRVAVK